MEGDFGLDTLALHAGQAPDLETGSRAAPIYQTASYAFPSAETAAKRFALSEEGNLYTKHGKSINAVLEKRFVAMHGGAKSLTVHPASMTHQQLSDVENAAAGVSSEMIRFSVELEDPEDLKRSSLDSVYVFTRGICASWRGLCAGGETPPDGFHNGGATWLFFPSAATPIRCSAPRRPR
ncbi:MAG: PLP-dependent transferase [Planctomycetota bacterium]|nr:PLP-dependent transferase [Planctomycetota bacterium]